MISGWKQGGIGTTGGGLGFSEADLVVPCDAVDDSGVGAVDEEVLFCGVGGLLLVEGVDDFGASSSRLNLGCNVIHELLRVVPPPNSIKEASFACTA